MRGTIPERARDTAVRTLRSYSTAEDSEHKFAGVSVRRYESLSSLTRHLVGTPCRRRRTRTSYSSWVSAQELGYRPTRNASSITSVSVEIIAGALHAQHAPCGTPLVQYTSSMVIVPRTQIGYARRLRGNKDRHVQLLVLHLVPLTCCTCDLDLDLRRRSGLG